MTSSTPPRGPWARVAAAAALLVLVGGPAWFAFGPQGNPPSLAPLPPASLPAAGNADVYVDPAGSDAAAGTAATPLATVDAAIRVAGPGSTIWLARGTYAPFSLSEDGLTIAGSPDGGSVIDGAAGQSGVAVVDADDVTILDIEVHGPAGSGRAGVLIERSRDVTVRGLRIDGVRGGFGIEVRFSSDVTISDNDVAHSAIAVRLYGEGDPASVHDVVIEGNWLHDSDSMVVDDPAPDNDYGGNGIVWHKVSGHTEARDNQLWNNSASSHDYGVDGGAFEIWGSSNVEISGNTAWDNVNVVETGTDGPPCTSLRFVGNTAFAINRGVGLILRCADDGLIAHNVLAGLRSYAFELSDRGSGNQFASSLDGLRILDNIVAGVLPYAIRNDLEGAIEADRNVLWNPSGSIATLPHGRRATSLPAFVEATGLDAGSVEADPRFVDPAGRDYHVLLGSPAIDLGTAVDDAPYTGSAPDAGRYEFDGAPTPS